MPIQQDFTPSALIDAHRLRNELQELFATIDLPAAARSAGLGALEDTEVNFKSFDVRQKAGIAVETIIITFATKLAYDVWKEIVLPRLKTKFGGAVVVPVTGVRDV